MDQEVSAQTICAPRLAIASVLHGAWDDLICTLGVLCSSWVFMNAGTSLRSVLLPMGNTRLPSVQSANMMVSR